MVKNFLIKNSPMKDEFCELQNYGNSLLVFGLESGSALTKAIADWTDSGRCEVKVTCCRNCSLLR